MLWWMPLAFVGVIVASLAVVVVAARRRREPTPQPDALPIAHTDRLTSLAAYRSALARYRALLAAIVVSAVVVLVAGVLLASRPVAPTLVYPELNNRDIVLCLDVSGSMVEYDTRIIEVFGALAEQFDGERVSLVVFNASAVTYFPLTSDYEYIQRQFAAITTQFASGDLSYFDGTFFGDGSSLVGDGLAACTLRFDASPVTAGTGRAGERSRSIILATDNLVIGDPIYTLPEAGALADDAGIRVYGLNAGDTGSKGYLREFAVEYEEVVARTGGAYFALDDPSAIDAIVAAIDAQEATALRGVPQVMRVDQPELLTLVALVALLVTIGVAWVARR